MQVEEILVKPKNKALEEVLKGGEDNG